jgi:UDP-N-acetylmuramoyl-L-alanyl-D-glutamate--2,6-diaminopimelate ligase
MLILFGMNPRSIVKRIIPTELFQKIEPLGHLGEAVAFNIVNGFPARGMKIIGVTGTNGKTTTVFLLQRMLYEAGFKAGMISTVAYGVDDDIKPQLTHMTTPTTPILMKRLKAMKAQGVEWLVLETTSQALAQNRVWGVPYTVVVFTNLTHEHLSYHKTFERYRNAKLKLFKMANRNPRGLRTGVVNSDDPNGHYFSESITHNLTYGIDSGDLKASHIKNTDNGVSFEAKIGSDVYHITCQIPGTFNVYNALAAVTVGRVIGLSAQQIEQGIADVPGVPGRMTRIDEGQDFTLIVDYAHTPDSFEKLFKDLQTQPGTIIAVFGSLGGGDKGKRFIQGEIAGKFADTVIVCEEDDRQENPDSIAEAIARGAEKNGKKRNKDLFLIHDRTEAIEFAVSKAHKDDLVLLLGKGHERTIESADGARPWDEFTVARRALRKR